MKMIDVDYYNKALVKTHIFDICQFKKEDRLLFIGEYNEVLISDLLKRCNKVDLAENNDVMIMGEYDKIIIYGKFNNNLNVYKKHLVDNGYLFIAVDNKYGMRFLSGAKGDKEIDYFSYVEGKSRVPVYSNLELRKMIIEAGFTCYFYYPLPEYQLPFVIYSEDYLPSYGQIINVAHSFNWDRYIVFDEAKALNEAVKSCHFETFANSFWIKCW